MPFTRDSIGYQGDSDTSAAAAVSMSGTAVSLRMSVLSVLKVLGPRTTDETARHLGESVLAIRPRFTELKYLGLIEDTGERRQNVSGRYAAVWCAKPQRRQLGEARKVLS